MPTFDFNTPPSQSSISGATGSLTFTDNLVTFTWSVSGDSFFHLKYVSGSSGMLTGSIGTFVSNVFTLDAANGVGQTQFFGSAGNPIGLSILSAGTGPWAVKFSGATPFTAFVTGPTVLSGIAGQFTQITFTSTAGVFDFIQIGSLTATINCFLEGTRVATPDGPVAVETLVPGMRISTADQGTTTVKWLGKQPVYPRFVHPAKVNPICITAGALAERVPVRDLCVSQDHAIAIDGLLINAGALVNGRTIYQVEKMPLDGFIYYHVETDAHELLLVEGVAAESFIDYAGRDGFLNGDERDGEPWIPEMDWPRISAARLVPEALRGRLNERAEAMAGIRRVA